MNDITNMQINAFDKFNTQWALVTAGTPTNFNSCTIGWGSFGNIWAQNGKTCQTITIYVHPARYTSEFLLKNDTFTVSFFSEKYKKALAYMGSHSGRNEDKATNAKLTPIAINNTMTYKEAETTFVCKKLYQHQFSKEDLAPEIQQYYASMPKIYPDFHGGWQPHYLFIGQVVETRSQGE